MNTTFYRIIKPYWPFLAVFFVMSISLNCLGASDMPSFPESSAVSQLNIRSHGSISEPARINEFLSELRKVKSGWGRPLFSFPSSQATVSLIDFSGGLLCVVHVGPNWLGSRCGLPEESQLLLVTLTVNQARYFRDFVDGKWEIK